MKLTIPTIVLLCSIYLQNSLFAQPVLEWVATYTGQSNSTAVEIVISDSGYIYTGSISNGGLVLKYHPDSTLMWEGHGLGGVRALDVDRWGNAVITGAINANYANIYTAKFANSDGHIIYSRQVDPVWEPSSDTGWDVALDSSGNAYITGWVFAGTHPNGTGNDWMTVAYPPLGDTTLWTSQYNGEENLGDKSYSIDVTPGGVTYLAGTTFKNSTNRLRIVKKNSWEKIYYLAPTLDLSSTIKIKVTEDEDVYVTAHMGHHEEKDAYLIKHDSSGNYEWTRLYNGPDSLEDYPVDLAVDNSGNVVVLCYSEDSLNAESMATLKYSPDGDTLWMKRYEYVNIEPKAIAIDSDNNVYALAGFTLVKYDSDGNEQWAEQIIHAVDIAVDAEQNIYTTGFAGWDIVTAKYSQQTSDINDDGNIYPTEFELSQNYPNPFNPSTKIRFTISEVRFTILKVYDVLGKEVATLVNEELPAGEYEVEFYSEGLTSGVYFYQLRAGSFVETKKMVLTK